MKILLVDDEPKTIDFLAQGFREAGFEVVCASDGEAGLELGRGSDIDVIVLDVMLPEIDGWTVLKRLRTCGIETPVLMLTARDQIDERVKGLDLGADDYLVKPFAFAELHARVRSLLRRAQTNHSADSSHAGEAAVADLRVDFVRQQAWRAGDELDLSAQEFRLLSFLVSNRGQVVSRSLILEEVWDIDFDPQTNVIDVAIRRLRRKVDDPYEPALIHTVRGVGYKLEVPAP